MIFVVGATGQLGTLIVRQLSASNQKVRALVRRASAYQHLTGEDVEIAFGDLNEKESLEEACRGIKAVIATANSQ